MLVNRTLAFVAQEKQAGVTAAGERTPDGIHSPSSSIAEAEAPREARVEAGPADQLPRMPMFANFAIFKPFNRRGRDAPYRSFPGSTRMGLRLLSS